jgi:hypothetical protein
MASIVLYTYYYGEYCSYYCSMWSIALYYVLGVLKSVSIGTSYNCIFYGMALVVSSPTVFWVCGNTYLAILYTFNIRLGAYRSA